MHACIDDTNERVSDEHVVGQCFILDDDADVAQVFHVRDIFDVPNGHWHGVVLVCHVDNIVFFGWPSVVGHVGRGPE